MKKAAVLFLSILLVLFLCACSASQTVYTVEEAGITFEVNTENGTIFDGTHTYKYTFTGDSSAYAVNITYPDGSRYYWNQSEHGGNGGWSDDYDRTKYVDGDTLCDVVAENAPSPSNPAGVFAVLFLLCVGLFNTAAPQAAWYLAYGWRYKDAEPSDVALVMTRIGGVAVIIIAVLMIFA